MTTKDVDPKTILADIPMERAVLGAILASANPGDVNNFLRKLQREDFYSYEHRDMYDSISQLGENVTVEGLAKLLASKWDRDQYNITVDLFGMVNDSFSAVRSYFTYVPMLKDLSERRAIVRACQRGVVQSLDLETSTNDIVVQLRDKLRLPGTENVIGGDVLARMLADELGRRIDGEIRGIRFPWVELNRVTGGLFPGETLVVAGETGEGKSAFMASCAIGVARAGFPVLYFSLEQGPLSIGGRVACGLADVDTVKFRYANISDDELIKLSNSFAELSEMPLFLNSRMVSVEEIERCILEVLEKGVDPDKLCVFVDYIQIVKPTREQSNREQEVAHISRELTRMARDYGLAVVMGCQLRRIVTKKRQRPTLERLRESGAIANDAWQIIGVFRPTRKDQGEGFVSREPLEAIVLKNREGPSDVTAKLLFRGQTVEVMCKTWGSPFRDDPQQWRDWPKGVKQGGIQL